MISVISNKGVPHESLWPYDVSQFDVEPPSSVVTDAASYKSTASATISTDMGADTAVNDIKKALNTPLPVMFIFDVYPEYDAAGTNGGYIGVPQAGDSSRGGHANVIVGYNDALANTGGGTGAFIVRNSWGTSWGASGYGYMPYAWAVQNPSFSDETFIKGAYVVSAESGLAPPPPTPSPSAPPSVKLQATIIVQEWQPKIT
jgi:C1A family cysteine protease